MAGGCTQPQPAVANRAAVLLALTGIAAILAGCSTGDGSTGNPAEGSHSPTASGAPTASGSRTAPGAPAATVADLPGAANATVVRGVDGDTIVIRSAGVDEKVRFLGIDTPESVKPDTPVECYGKEASAHMDELLPAGTEVVLVRDAETRDRYGRLLAYVYRARDALFVNLSMVVEGYAQPAAVAPNKAHTAEIAAAGRAAQQAGVGLWGACGGDDKFG